MLFNSFVFIFLFLPVTLWAFFAIGRSSHTLGAAWLAAASLFFYGWWNPLYVPLLLGSVTFNFLMGGRIGEATMPRRQYLMAFAVAANLALLGYYKYANFFLASVNTLAGSQFDLARIILPLGISFFTFTQIAFLVDTYRGYVKEYRFIHYLLFVTYFPHLIAGPVLHHKEMMPQFGNSETYRPSREHLAVGLTIFFIGLFKKTVIADSLAPYAGDLFSAPGEPRLLEAWGGALAYTFQLYFDFSGYSDMAIGLSRLFGIRLPLNFDSPYKAVNIIDFWRRWHMTLSRFLRDYLYIALGGSRKGKARRYANLMITMLLGGLWHGAGWTFLIWGGLHGVYLVINHGWQALRAHFGANLSPSTLPGRAAARALTFIVVVVGWVFFRAASLDDALAILRGMAGMNGISLPTALVPHLGSLKALLDQAGVVFNLGGGARFVVQYIWIATLLPAVFFLPNTQELMRGYQPALDYQQGPVLSRFAWRPSAGWAAGLALTAIAGLLSLSRISEFLYYQF